MPIRTLLVDDEPLARQTLRLLLARDADFTLAGECSGGRDAVAFVREQRPDLVLLDIQMPGLDGFQVIERIGVARMPPVIFVTAYDEYAVRAFEVQALDYLLKPFDDARFFQALARAREEIAVHDSRSLAERLAGVLAEKVGRDARPLARIALRSSGGRIVFVDASGIDRIMAEDYYVRLHVGGATHLWRVSMNALEKRLDPAKFLRIHRSAIVNLDFVREIHPGVKDDAFALLKDGTRLPVARSRRGRLRDLLTGKA
jgi:two-component system, LytTR family, response regulator